MHRKTRKPSYNKTLDEAIAEAKIYKNRRDLYRNDKPLYGFLQRNNLFDEIYGKVETYEKLTPEIVRQHLAENKYKGLGDFHKNNQRIYKFALKNNILYDYFTKPTKIKYNSITKDDIQKEALKFNTRKEFQLKSPKLYDMAIRKQIISEICGHMIPQLFSTPQLICKDILENLLQDRCIYNSKKILGNGKELDIFFPKFNIACEYNGSHWHKNDVYGTLNKIKICEDKDILLIVLSPSKEEENVFNRTVKLTADYIKSIIKLYLPEISKKSQIPISEKTVDNIFVDENVLSKNIYGPNEIQKAITESKTFDEFATKYSRYYQYLLRNNLVSNYPELEAKRSRLKPNTITDINQLKKLVIDRNLDTYIKFRQDSAYKMSLRLKMKNEMRRWYQSNMFPVQETSNSCNASLITSTEGQSGEKID